MTVTIERLNGDSKITFEVTALRAKIEDTADAATRYVYDVRWQLYDDGEPIPYDDLTLIQRRAVLNKELIYHLKGLATSSYILDLVATARTEAVAEAETKFDIEEET